MANTSMSGSAEVTMQTPKSGASDTIQLNRAVYQHLVAQNRKYETRLKAMSHIPGVLHEKDQQLRRYQDRERQYEAALMRTHRHLANTIRINTMQASTGPAKPKEATIKLQARNWAPVKTQSLGNQSISGQDYLPDLRSGEGVDLTRGGKVVIDGDGGGSSVATRIQPHKPSAIPHYRLESDSACGIGAPVPHGTASVSTPSFSQTEECSIPSMGTIVEPVSVTMPTDPQFTEPPTRVITAPGVSKEIFDRVVEKNVRLQGTLDSIQRDSSVDVGSLLTASEYEEVVRQLRLELSQARVQLEELHVMNIARDAGNADSLMQKCVDLLNKVNHLEKMVTAKQALIDSYSGQYDILKKQNEQLKIQLQQIQQQYSQLKQQQQQQQQDTEMIVSQPSANASISAPEVAMVTEQTSFDTERKQLLSQIDDLKQDISGMQLKHKKEVQEKDLLAQKCEELTETVQSLMQSRPPLEQFPETIYQLRQDNKRFIEETQLLKHEMKQFKEEKEIQQTQLKFFQEDFNNEKAEKAQLKEQSTKQIQQLKQEMSKLKVAYDQEKKWRMQGENEISKLKTVGRSISYGSLEGKASGRSSTSYDSGLGGSMSSSMKSSIDSGYSASARSSMGVSSIDEGVEMSSYSTSSMPASVTPHRCDHCWQEFKQKSQYDEHVKKCLI